MGEKILSESMVTYMHEVGIVTVTEREQHYYFPMITVTK
jgi:hypothetical protein